MVNQPSIKPILARLGGEEFCEVDFTNTRLRTIENLETTLCFVKNMQLNTPKIDLVNISFSPDMAEYAVDGLTLDGLLRNANKTLYLAKANGLSRLIPYAEDLFGRRDMTLIAKLYKKLPAITVLIMISYLLFLVCLTTYGCTLFSLYQSDILL